MNENAAIQQRSDDVQGALNTVRQELMDQLPKMKRAGRLITKDLDVSVTPVGMTTEAAA